MNSDQLECLEILENFGINNIPADWGVIRVEDILESERGVSVGVMYPGKNHQKGVPLLKVVDVRNNWISDTPEFKISPDKHHEYRRTELEGGELLITLVGQNSCQTAVVPESMKGWNAARAIAVTRIDSLKGNVYFVKYALQSPSLQLIMKNWSNTTVQETLNLKEIRRIPIPMPPLTEQKAIAQILGTLDDKIELNRKTNETLEGIAKALFESWFVDFDPVRAKAEGRPTGLPDEISELFPDSFEETELGEIPSGWSVAEIGNFLDLERDSVTPSASGEEIFDHYSIPAYDEGLMPSIETGQSIKSNKYLVTDGVFMVSKLNPRFPRIWVPSKHTTRRRICSTEFLVCRPKVKVETPFVLHVAKSRSVVQQMGDLASGTSNSHQRVRPADFVGLPFVKPSAALVKLFSEMVEPILEKHLLTRNENQALSKCRDALLPRLISGELRVPDAEKMLEEVGI